MGRSHAQRAPTSPPARAKPGSTRSTGWPLAALAAASVTAPAASAAAYEAEVDATFSAQFYSVTPPYGAPLVRRRRYVQTLALGVYDLHGNADPAEPQLSFRGRIRMDADFGQLGNERDPRDDSRFVPGMREAPLDVMYAYLEGKNYLGGWLGFRAGRQYVTDALGWWSFDGGLLRITTPAYFAVEAYGGFEQRAGLPMLATPRWRAQGVYAGNRDELQANQWPSFLEEARLAPAYGFNIESTDLSWLAAKIGYRRVINRDVVYISPSADDLGEFRTIGGDRVSSERVGGSLGLYDAEFGSVDGRIVWDFLNQLVSEYDAGADWYVTDRVTLGLHYEYYLPTFDGDSIFNWFTHTGSRTATARGEWRATQRLELAASGGLRWFQTEGDPDTYGRESSPDTDPPERSARFERDWLGSLGSRYRWPAATLAFRGFGEVGYTGHRVGGDVDLTNLWDSGRYDTRALVSLYDWSDDLRPGRDALSFSYVLGAGYSPIRNRARVGVEWEHATNRLVGQRYRLLATLDLTVLQ